MGEENRSNGEKRIEGGEEEESKVDQAVVRAGYRSLMDDITTNEEELGDVSGQCHTRLREYMEANEELFHQVEQIFLFVTPPASFAGVSSSRSSVGRKSVEATVEAVPNPG